MIKKDALGDYRATCDKCGKDYGVTFYLYHDAEIELKEANWHVVEGLKDALHICTDCQ